MLPQVSADEVAELLTPEQRHGVLAHIAVEELAKTLTPDQRFGVLLAMSDDILRQLPNTLIDSLPESVRAEIQRRLAH